MVFNTQLNSLHKNGETCHRMRAPKKVIINDIRTRGIFLALLKDCMVVLPLEAAWTEVAMMKI